MIIDDEEVVRDSCSEILMENGYKLATASNGSSGLRLVEAFHPDIVFVDLKMPGMSGLDVLREIKTIDPTIVTIVITGYATVDSAVEAMKLGTHDFLPKPFTPDEFRVITRRALERRDLILETESLRREKEMLRANFAAIVSHELKSPLSAVQQNLYVLSSELSDQLNEDQLQRCERMKSRIDQLLEMIRRWLRVISVDLEAIKEDFKEISIESVIQNAVDSVQPHATRKDIELITEVERPLLPVFGDQVTLNEVLVNIIDNAIKYSYPGNEVKILAKNQDGKVLVSVVDNGVGIADEDLPYIFDDFYSGKQGQQETKGYGLGLALSKRIVEIHEGSISVDSKVGEGSVFSVILPARIKTSGA